MASKRVKQPPRRVGPVYEDGSYRTQDGRVYDPESRVFRAPLEPRTAPKAARKRTPGMGGERSGRWPA